MCWKRRTHDDAEGRTTLVTLSFYLFLLLLNVCGPVGIGMIFIKNERITLINQYNALVDIWESNGYLEMDTSSFSLTVDDEEYMFSKKTQGFGNYYPHRDACNKRGDPECHKDSVLHFETTCNNAGNATIALFADDYGSILFNETVPFNSSIHLYKKDISCVGGSEETCTNECRRHRGIWKKDSNTCFVQMYLNHICLRIVYHNETEQWSLDEPSQRTLYGSSVSYGCEPIVKGNLLDFNSSLYWLPLIYSHTPPDNVTVTLRHYQDPYIASASITNGCSSSNHDAHACFGRSHEEDMMFALMLISIGGVGVCIDLILFLTLFILTKLKKRIPLWLTPLRLSGPLQYADITDEKEKDMKDKNNEAASELLGKSGKPKGDSNNLDMYSPLMKMRHEADSYDISFNPTLPQRHNAEYSIATPSFRGDEEGI